MATVFFSVIKVRINSIAPRAAIPPERLKKTETSLPVIKADNKHLEIRTRKQSEILNKPLLLIIYKTTILASPIFAPGQKGKEGIRSSTENNAKETAVNKEHIIMRLVFFTRSPHQSVLNQQ